MSTHMGPCISNSLNRLKYIDDCPIVKLGPVHQGLGFKNSIKFEDKYVVCFTSY